jgi:pilus assembly protein CpaC
LYLGRSEIINAPWSTARVSVTDPKVADVKVLTPKQVLVQGKGLGTTDVILWSENEQIWRARVTVSVDITALQEKLKKVLPGSRLQLVESGQVVIVTGTLRTARQADQMHRFLDALEIPYADFSGLAGVQQVMLKVRVAEASRNALKTLGINWVYTGNDHIIGNPVGSSSGGAVNPIPFGIESGQISSANLPFTFTDDVTTSASVTLFAGIPEWDLATFIQALAEDQYLRLLAEPTLVALSGEEATFLAGGEFPIPVVQGTSGVSNSVTIEYREFGVALRFRPIVQGDGSIRLYVAPEVSELSDIGAVVLQGFRVPGVLTRRAATTLELKSGQTFAMAGLIQSSTTSRNSRIPGMGDLPILGPLFRSVRYERGETELVVLVTVHLVEPLSARELPPVPGVLHDAPNDWALYCEGRLEDHTPARISKPDAAWMKSKGLDRLRGPGAWAAYGERPRGHATLRPAVPAGRMEPPRSGPAGPPPVQPRPEPEGPEPLTPSHEPVDGARRPISRPR